jgi:hypothetical protein
MVEPFPTSERDQVVDAMIGLTRLASPHPAIVAGSGSMELYLALRRRGFLRAATVATCRNAKGQHPVGLVAGHNSLQAIEGALVQLSPFLGASAAVAVLIDSPEIGAGLRIRGKLEQMGFRIEAGVRCRQGLVLSAIRRGFGQVEKAA